MSSKQVALQLLVLKALEAITKPANVEGREAAMSLLDKGDRVNVVSPVDGKTEIGHILRTKPKMKANVTDRPALDEWLRKTYDEKLELKQRIASEDLKAALAVLEEHAPELITTEQVVPDWLVNTVLVLSEGAGEPVGPGGETEVPGVTVEIPEGSITVNLDKKSGVDAVRNLFAAGLVAVDGTLRELPSGDAA